MASKFKAGDRVRVYRSPGPFTGIIETITTGTDGAEWLGVIEDGFYSQHGDGPFHPEQCRRLVKRKKKSAVPEGYEEVVMYASTVERELYGKIIQIEALWETFAEAIRNKIAVVPVTVWRKKK